MKKIIMVLYCVIKLQPKKKKQAYSTSTSKNSIFLFFLYQYNYLKFTLRLRIENSEDQIFKNQFPHLQVLLLRFLVFSKPMP